MAFDREFASATVFCEASSLSPLARRGVASVICQRLRLAPRFGTTLAQVVLRYHQFSEWNGDPTDNRNLLRVATVDENDPVLFDCCEAMDQAQAGYKNPADGATHFYDTRIKAPDWAVGAELVCHIDTLAFYKGVK